MIFETDFFSLLFAENTISLPFIVSNFIIVFAFIGVLWCLWFAWWFVTHFYCVDYVW